MSKKYIKKSSYTKTVNLNDKTETVTNFIKEKFVPFIVKGIIWLVMLPIKCIVALYNGIKYLINTIKENIAQ